MADIANWDGKLRYWLTHRGGRPMHWSTGRQEPRCGERLSPTDQSKPVPRCASHEEEVEAIMRLLMPPREFLKACSQRKDDPNP